MRPLNRPMFRYGGPIKEGIMDGIREPKKNGGMLLVGEHPKEFKDAGGREKHVAPIVYGAGLGLARLAPLAMRGARALKGLFGSTATRSTTGNFAGPMKRFYEPAGYSGKVTEKIFTPNKVGRYIMGSPEYRLITGGAGYAGKAGKKLFEGGKYIAKSPLTVGGGLIYVGGKFFKDGKEVPPPPNTSGASDINKIKAAIGMPENLTYRPPTDESKKGGGVELSDKEKRQKRIDRYRDIMDIKGMNKAAAYDSLIAASKAIGESGDFKGDLKSGRLINQIIQSTSKAFDKPKQTKDAIDTLILKGEIEKDIKASDPKAQRQADLLEKQIKIADKTLAGDSFTDIITDRYKKGKTPRGKDLANILRATEKVEVTTVDSSKIPQGVDAQTFFESQVNEAKTAGTPIVPGYYVIDDRVLIVDAQGNVTPYL